MLDRIPDSGAPVRDQHGPLRIVVASIVDAVRAERAAGVPVLEVARRYRVSPRTVARYCNGPADPAVRDVAGILRDAVATYGLDLTSDQIADMASAVTGRLRLRGVIAEHPEVHEPGDVRRRVDYRGHGHVCPQCEGNATVRRRGRPAGERVACPSCGGTGHLRARGGSDA